MGVIKAKPKAGLNYGVYLIAFVLTLMIYFNILSYGFDYDDYHQVRPYSSSKVLRSFYSTWDETGIERSFYRPVINCFFAARFELLGYNPFWHHVLSIVMYSFSAWLIYMILYRYSAKNLFSILGMIVFIAYPYMSYAAVAWSASQLHILSMILFFSAWLWMLYIEGKKRGWLFMLYLFQILAFGAKEDGILLLPALFILWYVKRTIFEKKFKLDRFECGFWSGAIVLIVLLFLWRQAALGTVGGYQTFSVANVLETLFKVLFLSDAVRWYTKYHAYIGQLTRLFVVLITGAGFILLMFYKFKERMQYVNIYIAGIVVLCVFNILTVFSTKIYQLHMQSTGHSIIIAVSIYIILKYAKINMPKVISTLLISFAGMGVIGLMITTRILSTSFAPYSYQTIEHDKKVLQWRGKIPERHIDYLLRKSQNPLFHRFDDDKKRL